MIKARRHYVLHYLTSDQLRTCDRCFFCLFARLTWSLQRIPLVACTARFNRLHQPGCNAM